MVPTLLVLLWSCGDALPPDAPSTPSTGAVVVDAGHTTASGGHLWALALDTQGPLRAELDGVRLATVRSRVRPAAHVFHIPSGHPTGPAQLVLTDSQGVQETREVTVLPPRFRRVEQELGLHLRHDMSFHEAGCAQSLTGFAWSDLDLDGHPDAILAHFGAPTQVLLHDGTTGGLPHFDDITDAAGLTVDQVGGLALADVDGDGDPDLFVGRRGANRLFRNEFVEEGLVRFTDITAEVGLDDAESRTMGAVWGDPDQDGDLDLYVLNHHWCLPGEVVDADLHPVRDRFWRNEGTEAMPRFVERSALVPDDDGQRSERLTFVGVWVDHERDGDQDLFIVSDHVAEGGPSILLRNDDPEALVLTDVSEATGFGLNPDPSFKGVNGMGLAVGDIDHDGFPDMAVSNIGPNLLLQSVPAEGGGRHYVNTSVDRGTTRTTLPWGQESITWSTQMFDHDNDGDLELLYVGGPIGGPDGLYDPMPHAFFDQVDGVFADRTFASGLSGIDHGKASALADIDHDGDLDVAVTNWDGTLEVYENTSDRLGHHWLQVDLEGDGVRTHRDAFGAIVELTTPDGVVHTCFRTPRPALSAGGDTACHFGLGTHDHVDALVITWPDGRTLDHPPPEVDQRVVVVDEGAE